MNKTTEKWESEESADAVRKVHEAQIQQLYGQTWGGLAGIMVIMVSVCVVLWHVIPQWKLLLWSGTLVLLSASHEDFWWPPFNARRR